MIEGRKLIHTARQRPGLRWGNGGTTEKLLRFHGLTSLKLAKVLSPPGNKCLRGLTHGPISFK